MAGIPAPKGRSTAPGAEFDQAVARCPLLNGQLITADFDGVDSVEVRHSLRRPYRGAFVVCSTDAGATPAVTALDAPSVAALGADPSRFLYLGAASAFTATVTLWVF